MVGSGMRTSVLSRALLGLLAAEPMSGYGLARLFERTLARAWPARHPQIYPALAGLEEHGLLRVIETGPRRRKTYAVTEDGIAEVQRWLRESAPDRTVRNESILRLFMPMCAARLPIEMPSRPSTVARFAAARRIVCRLRRPSERVRRVACPLTAYI